MSTKIIQLKDIDGNILLPQAYSASHDNHGNDFSLVYATITTVNTKANDSAVVHLSGNETITGVKTLNTSDQISLILKGSSIDSTLTPSSTQYGNFIDSKDKNDTRISRVFSYRDTAGANGIGIQAWDSSTNYAITVDSLGIATAPTPSSATDNTTKIATTAWVNSHIDVNPNVVRTTGSQTITGAKTFNTGANDAVRFISTINTQEIPEANRYYQPIGISDPSNTYYDGYFEIGHFTDGSHALQIVARQNVEGTNYHSVIGARIAQDGTTWGTCPASDKNGSIVITSGMSKSTNGYVKLGNGLIIQHGYVSAPSSGAYQNATVTMPTAFTSTNYVVLTGSQRNNNLSDGYAYYLGSIGALKTTTTFGIYLDNTNYVTGCYWLAIGY